MTVNIMSTQRPGLLAQGAHSEYELLAVYRRLDRVLL